MSTGEDCHPFWGKGGGCVDRPCSWGSGTFWGDLPPAHFPLSKGPSLFFLTLEEWPGQEDSTGGRVPGLGRAARRQEAPSPRRGGLPGRSSLCTWPVPLGHLPDSVQTTAPEEREGVQGSGPSSAPKHALSGIPTVAPVLGPLSSPRQASRSVRAQGTCPSSSLPFCWSQPHSLCSRGLCWEPLWLVPPSSPCRVPTFSLSPSAPDPCAYPSPHGFCPPKRTRLLRRQHPDSTLEREGTGSGAGLTPHLTDRKTGVRGAVRSPPLLLPVGSLGLSLVLGSAWEAAALVLLPPPSALCLGRRL